MGWESSSSLVECVISEKLQLMKKEERRACCRKEREREDGEDEEN